MNCFYKTIKQQVLWICCFFFLGMALQAQPEKLSPDAEVSVLTCGSGDQLYSIFGHTAIRFKDPSQHIDVVFNYGTFDFNTPNFYAKFVKGDLMYHLSANTYADFVYNYEADNRSIDEQFLNLSLEQKQKIWDQILIQLNSDKRFYQYKFIENNCTTKVVDLLNNVLPAALNTKFEGNTETYRYILNTYLQDRYFEKLGINLIFGVKTDLPNTLVFLPDKLFASINHSANGEVPLVKNNVKVFTAEPDTAFHFFNSYWFFLLLCIGFAGLAYYRGFRLFWMILLGFLGVLFILIGLYSLHRELFFNNVVLLCNPVFFVYLLICSKLYKKITWFVLAGSLLVYCVWIDLEKLYMFSPLLFVTFVVLFWEYKFYKKITLTKHV